MKHFVLSLMLLVLMWDKVTVNLDNKPVKIKQYNLYKRKVGQAWPSKPYVSRVSTSYSTTLKTEWEFAVTAVSTTNLESGKSNTVIINKGK